MKRSHILLVFVLILLAVWTYFKYASGDVPTSPYNTATFYVIIVLVSLVVISVTLRVLRYLKDTADDLPGTQGRRRRDMIIATAQYFLDKAMDEKTATLITNIKEERRGRKEALDMLRKYARAMYKIMPPEERPEKFNPNKMTMQELDRFLTRASVELIITEGNDKKAPKGQKPKAPSTTTPDPSDAFPLVFVLLLMLEMQQIEELGAEKTAAAEELRKANEAFELRGKELEGVREQLRRQAEVRAQPAVVIQAPAPTGPSDTELAAVERANRLETAAAETQSRFDAQAAELQRQTAARKERILELDERVLRLNEQIGVLEAAAATSAKNLQTANDNHATSAQRLNVQITDLTRQRSQLAIELAEQKGIVARQVVSLEAAVAQVRELVLTCNSEREIATKADKLYQAERDARAGAEQREKAGLDRERALQATNAALQTSIAELPPFAFMVSKVREALKSPDAFVAFVRELGDDPATREQALFALITTSGAAERLSEIVAALSDRAEKTDESDEVAMAEAGERLDLVFTFTMEAVEILIMAFVETFYYSTQHGMTSPMGHAFACVLNGFSLSSEDRRENLLASPARRRNMISALERPVQIGMAEYAEQGRSDEDLLAAEHVMSDEDILVYCLRTKHIKRALDEALSLLGKPDITEQQYRDLHGARGKLRRTDSTIEDPERLRTLRWLVRTSETHRGLFRNATDEISALYKLSPASWWRLLTLLLRADDADAPISREKMKKLLGYDPRYVLTFMDTRPETLKRYRVSDTLEPFNTLAKLLNERGGQVTSPLTRGDEFLEAWIFRDDSGIPRHVQDVKDRTIRGQAIPNRGNQLTHVKPPTKGNQDVVRVS